MVDVSVEECSDGQMNVSIRVGELLKQTVCTSTSSSSISPNNLSGAALQRLNDTILDSDEGDWTFVKRKSCDARRREREKLDFKNKHPISVNLASANFHVSLHHSSSSSRKSNHPHHYPVSYH
jgi:hypothetical protein